MTNEKVRAILKIRLNGNREVTTLIENHRQIENTIYNNLLHLEVITGEMPIGNTFDLKKQLAMVRGIQSIGLEVTL